MIAIPLTGGLTAAQAFAPDMTGRASLRLVSVLPNFVRWFSAKREAAAAPLSLEWFELQRNASHSAILAAWKDDTGVETTLAAAYWLITQQPAGQPGLLATNGFGSAFYVRDSSGSLRSVNIHWCGDGWSVDAMSIESHTDLPIRDRVFRQSIQTKG
ncbi:MAG TPA: hypothetical protein VGK48_24505 [Terriglobia bacterium]|jgi:hypothetical protein